MKYIKGWEGIYSVCSTGKVYAHSKDIWLSLINNGNGYLRVGLINKGAGGKYKIKYVHRLVAETFIPNPEKHRYVGHRDHDKENNRVENLYWTDARTNTKDGISAGRINYKGRCGDDGMKTYAGEVIKNAYIEMREGGTLMEVSRKYGVHRSTLSSWVNKKSRSDITNLLDKQSVDTGEY